MMTAMSVANVVKPKVGSWRSGDQSGGGRVVDQLVCLLMAEITPSDQITGVAIVKPDVHADDRGKFVETYRRSWFPEGREMLQGNRAERSAGCVVGLHYHLKQADYWYLLRGKARVVLHDFRKGSPTVGATMTYDLSEDKDTGIYIPPGVAHGFSSLTDMLLTYLVDGYYNGSDELGILWNDEDVSADWGIGDPIVSKRDATNPRRSEIPDYLVPRY